ncbi:MAG: hypothetical protein WKG07_21540 [Hymenobacter sp.]
MALALGSCGGSDATKPANLLASNDFESLDGWLGGEVGPSLTREQAHSGVYSVKVDPKVDYSMGYSNPLGRLSSSQVTKLKLHGWVFLPSNQAENPADNAATKPQRPQAWFTTAWIC